MTTTSKPLGKLHVNFSGGTVASRDWRIKAILKQMRHTVTLRRGPPSNIARAVKYEDFGIHLFDDDEWQSAIV